MVVHSPATLGRAALGVLPVRRFSRILLAVSSALVLFVIIHANSASLYPSTIRERVQETWSNIARPPSQSYEKDHKLHRGKPQGNQQNHKSGRPTPHGDPVEDAYNSTLGFEKVFYISMPYRTDRQDAMNMIAHSTNVKLTYEPGVNGKEIHNNARPESSKWLTPQQLGCWRAHANLWSRILSEGISTALIVEDDADWDVNIHESFALMSQQLRESNVLRGRDLSEYEKAATPYGLDWDLMYVGHCWDNRNEDDSAHIHYDDPDAPNLGELNDKFRYEIESYGYKVTNSTRQRLLTNTWSPICTIAYAVTQQGAKKLLYNIGGYRGMSAPVDLAMTGLIKDGILKGVTVIPPLIVDFSLDIKSDINKEPVDEPVGPLQGSSENLKNSARYALAVLGEVPGSQSPEAVADADEASDP